MDVITTSLEALIQRVTNPQNLKLDTAAIDAFCVMLGKEADGIQIASRLLSSYMQSPQENEALQALLLLDTCMKRCGRQFHSEVGKFRFLNEMIKLVSPKYLGNKTPTSVRQKVLELLHTWTSDYPREVKIKEAYDMLRKQGVIGKECALSMEKKNNISESQKVKNALFEDEETVKLLQELLQSKDPFELQLANKLIKSMVKDDERRIQQKSERNSQLESVHTNVKVLSEMLDSHDPGEPNSEDMELMKELYQSCERFKPTLLKFADETQDNEDMLGQVLIANDELSQVFEKYANIIGAPHTSRGAHIDNGLPLLDFSLPPDSMPSGSDQVDNESDRTSNIEPQCPKTDMEMLDDIFKSMGNIEPSEIRTDSDSSVSNLHVMQPMKISSKSKEIERPNLPDKIDKKAKALEDLNELGRSILQQSLSDSAKSSSVNKTKSTDFSTNLRSECSEQLINSDVLPAMFVDNQNINKDNSSIDALSGVSNTMVSEKELVKNEVTSHDRIPTVMEIETKPLTDIHVTLEDIKPSSSAPLTVINNKNDISVILHVAEGIPHSDVSIIVITTTSKNSRKLSNYLFQAVVPDKCKCRLQKPSGIELPAHNPFLPPPAITQIMLIAHPRTVALSLKFMLSYTIDDETYTEMGEVDHL